MQELVEADKRFIESMEFLVENYVKPFEKVPAMMICSKLQLQRQKMDLFGAIECILDVHKTIVHPTLTATCDDVIKFAKSISKMCRDGIFNSYIVYALDEKDCEYRRLNYYKFFFMDICNKIGQPWNFQPIPQIISFKKFIINMRQKLQDMAAPNEKIQAMIQAENDFQQMLDKIVTAGKHGGN
jgi:hypothetical protein